MTTKYKTISKQKHEIIAFLSNFKDIYVPVNGDFHLEVTCPNTVVADTLAIAIRAKGYITKDTGFISTFIVQLVEPTITIDALTQAMIDFPNTQSDDDEDIKNGPTSRSMAYDVMGKFADYLGIEP